MSDFVRQDVENEIKSGSWDAIRRRVRLQTAKLRFRATDLNDDGHNFFHILCANSDAPPDIVLRMIELDENYLRMKSKSVWHPNYDHPRIAPATALHFAAESGSLCTIKILLERVFKLRRWRRSPRSLGALPFHDPWYTDDRQSPLDTLWTSRLHLRYTMLNGEVTNVRSVSEFLNQLHCVAGFSSLTTEMKDFWEKTACFLHAAFYGSVPSLQLMSGGNQWLIIHRILENAGKHGVPLVPMEVLWFATKIFSDHLRLRDKHGDLPLHVALRNPTIHLASCAKRLALRGILPRSSKKSELAIPEELVERLKSIYHECSETSVLGVLLGEFPKAATISDMFGALPLHILCEALIAKTMPIVSNSDFNDLMKAAPLNVSRIDTKDLLKAAPKAPFSPNSEGDSPLHILCRHLGCGDDLIGTSVRCNAGFAAKLYSMQYDRQQTRNTIMSIIESTPRAALVRNRSGRMPLHILLRNGAPAREKWVVGEEKWRIVVADTAMVHTLVGLAPETLDIPDIKTRLLPFMMAAIGKNASVDCAYSLLRANPASLRGGIIDSISCK